MIKLKSPWKYFDLSASAWSVMKQLKSANPVDFRKKGIWTKHYTMTLWHSEAEMKKFATSNAHMKAMKKSCGIAKEIRTISIEANKLPKWSRAIQLLAEGKVMLFNQ